MEPIDAARVIEHNGFQYRLKERPRNIRARAYYRCIARIAHDCRATISTDIDGGNLRVGIAEHTHETNNEPLSCPITTTDTISSEKAPDMKYTANIDAVTNNAPRQVRFNGYRYQLKDRSSQRLHYRCVRYTSSGCTAGLSVDHTLNNVRVGSVTHTHECDNDDDDNIPNLSGVVGNETTTSSIGNDALVQSILEDNAPRQVLFNGYKYSMHSQSTQRINYRQDFLFKTFLFCKTILLQLCCVRAYSLQSTC